MKMRMRIILIVLFINSLDCFSQNSAQGNYLAITPYSVSFFKLKKSHKVKWYRRGCTDHEKLQIGTWSQKNDTVQIEINNKIDHFILSDESLCHIDKDGKPTPIEYGIRKTRIKTRLGVFIKAEKVRKSSPE